MFKGCFSWQGMIEGLLQPGVLTLFNQNSLNSYFKKNITDILKPKYHATIKRL